MISGMLDRFVHTAGKPWHWASKRLMLNPSLKEGNIKQSLFFRRLNRYSLSFICPTYLMFGGDWFIVFLLGGSPATNSSYMPPSSSIIGIKMSVPFVFDHFPIYINLNGLLGFNFCVSGAWFEFLMPLYMVFML